MCYASPRVNCKCGGGAARTLLHPIVPRMQVSSFQTCPSWFVFLQSAYRHVSRRRVIVRLFYFIFGVQSLWLYFCIRFSKWRNERGLVTARLAYPNGAWEKTISTSKNAAKPAHHYLSICWACTLCARWARRIFVLLATTAVWQQSLAGISKTMLWRQIDSQVRTKGS